MDEALSVPSKSDLSTEALTWADHAKSVSITDAATSVRASHLLMSIKNMQKTIAAWFAPHLDAAMETKRKAEAARKGLADEQERMTAPLVTAETQVKRALLQWEAQQDEIRRERERALQADAQRRAETLTLDAAAALEREATATQNPELLQEAQDLLAQPIDTPVVSVASSMPKVQGVTYRDAWKIHPEIDLKALAAAVGAGRVPSTFLLPNLSALNAFARATQGTQPVPGVKFFNDRTIAARG